MRITNKAEQDLRGRLHNLRVDLTDLEDQVDDHNLAVRVNGVVEALDKATDILDEQQDSNTPEIIDRVANLLRGKSPRSTLGRDTVTELRRIVLSESEMSSLKGAVNCTSCGRKINEGDAITISNGTSDYGDGDHDLSCYYCVNPHMVTLTCGCRTELPLNLRKSTQKALKSIEEKHVCPALTEEDAVIGRGRVRLRAGGGIPQEPITQQQTVNQAEQFIRQAQAYTNATMTPPQPDLAAVAERYQNLQPQPPLWNDDDRYEAEDRDDEGPAGDNG